MTREEALDYVGARKSRIVATLVVTAGVMIALGAFSLIGGLSSVDRWRQVVGVLLLLIGLVCLLALVRLRAALRGSSGRSADEALDDAASGGRPPRLTGRR